TTYLTRTPISLDALVAEVAQPACGGTCLFLGTVRDGPDEHGVTAIEYSAYEAMVDAEFGRLLADARDRWPEARIAVRHRLGTIPVGEASIAIVAAAPHRAQAFEACRKTSTCGCRAPRSSASRRSSALSPCSQGSGRTRCGSRAASRSSATISRRSSG